MELYCIEWVGKHFIELENEGNIERNKQKSSKWFFINLWA